MMKEGSYQEIELHPKSPEKSSFGTPCNGCGVCCAASPCPVAVVFLFQIKGKCRALLWQDGRYVCGMAVSPDLYVMLIPEKGRELCARFFASRIAAGSGCDSTAEIDCDIQSIEID
jgi:hypothetical protein